MPFRSPLYHLFVRVLLFTGEHYYFLVNFNFPRCQRSCNDGKLQEWGLRALNACLEPSSGYSRTSQSHQVPYRSVWQHFWPFLMLAKLIHQCIRVHKRKVPSIVTFEYGKRVFDTPNRNLQSLHNVSIFSLLASSVYLTLWVSQSRASSRLQCHGAKNMRYWEPLWRSNHRSKQRFDFQLSAWGGPVGDQRSSIELAFHLGDSYRLLC